MYAQRRDDNERDLIDHIWRPAGAIFIAMDRRAGFDGLLCFNGQVFIVEIKDGSKPASKQELTPLETGMKNALARIGVKYHIVRNREDAATLIGAAWTPNLI